VGVVLVLTNPVFFVVALNLVAHLGASDRVWGDFIVIGALAGIVSLLCGFVGKGQHRWKVVTAAFCETFVWWFMAVGL